MPKKKCKYGTVKGGKRCKTKKEFVTAMKKGKARAKNKRVTYESLKYGEGYE